ncbi:MAG: hypothetical protein ACXVYY_08730 [Oryzihumus sp.]
MEEVMALSRTRVVLLLAGMAVLAGGTAEAASGGTFILGRANAATTTTTLSNPYGTALSLGSPAGRPPLLVGTNTTKVPSLDADLVDGLDSSVFQRRVSGACQVGSSVVSVSATGAVVCRATSASSMVVTGQVSNLGGGAYCPAGWVLGGGGFEQPYVSDESRRDLLRASRPSQGSGLSYNGWVATFDPRAVNSFQVNQPTTVYAVCLKVG